ncbi:MAG: winged helix-turn-helix domain-containing protein [Chloroflexi bacterium]|nr:winged helix-turn-helix domain-containing protein [Chloroflexota bacterium]
MEYRDDTTTAAELSSVNASERPRPRWGLLTNHALVLIHVIEHPRSTLRDIAEAVGITERAALSLLRALEYDSIIARRKEGRRNEYTVDIDALMAHRTHGSYSISQIASGLFALSGRIPGADLPPGMRVSRGENDGAAARVDSAALAADRLSAP